jgi:TRAP-type uncharacterized transport system substrate-binding protein
MEELKAARGVLVLPFPEEKFSMLPDIIRQYLRIVTLPAGYISSIDRPTPVTGIQSLLICRDDLDEQTAYLVTKVIMEQAQDLVATSGLFKEWGVPEYALSEDFVIPVHPGAIKYYKEIGIWKPAHEARQKERLDKLPK